MLLKEFKMKLEQDLHLHTTYSDGVWEPRRVVKEAAKKGLKRIAITDHDSIGGIEEAVEEAKKYNLTVIPGVELSSEEIYDGLTLRNSEILVYNMDLKKMQTTTSQMQKIRLKKIQNYIDAINKIYKEKRVEEVNSHIEKKAEANSLFLAYKLKPDVKNPISIKSLVSFKRGKELSEEEAEEVANKTTFVSFDIVLYMIEHYLQNPDEIKKIHIKKRGYPVKELYKPYIFDEKNAQRERTQKEAIQIALDCNGIPVLAHPGVKNEKVMQRTWLGEHDKSKIDPEKWVEKLVSYGLKGIELYYYAGNGLTKEESIKTNAYFHDLAQKHNLIITYGTDCHGPKEGKPLMGKLVKKDPLNKIIKNLNFR